MSAITKNALPEKSTQERVRRSVIMTAVVALMFLALIIRLVFIQIFSGDENFVRSVDNQVVQETIKAPRGIIYDRNGVILAQNRPSYSVGIIPISVPRNFPIVDNLLKIRDRNGAALFDSTELVNAISRARRRSTSQLAILREDISFDFVSVISERSAELPGIVIETSMRRDYPGAESIFHVIGYLSIIDSLQFDTLRFMGYQRNDFIGRSGIERQYESFLRGVDGSQFVERNAFGRRLGVAANFPSKAPIPGDNIYLTIDAKMQRIAFEAFEDTMKGAVVALDPRTGEVLCIVSFPSVNPNIFSFDSRTRERYWRRVVNDPARPLTNRAVVGTYPPGSTFKAVSALSAIDRNFIEPTGRFPRPCTGAFRFGNRTARCWYRNGHGPMNMFDAMRVSCNVYFYQLGLRVGDVIINHYSSLLGLGGRTGIDLPTESAGYMSGREAYNLRFRNRGWQWTEGLVLDLAIGQQQIFTPLQLAVMTGAICNTQERYRPFLAQKIINSDGEIVLNREVGDAVFSLSEIKPSSFEAVKRSLLYSVHEAGGTGRRARVDGIPVAGKTGTAENPLGPSHALFVAAAPMDNPAIAIAVVVENVGGGGGRMAAPIAGSVLNYFFNETEEGQKIAAEYRAARTGRGR